MVSRLAILGDNISDNYLIKSTSIQELIPLNISKSASIF